MAKMTKAQLVEVLRACCCVAAADGETSPDEMAHLQRLADDQGVGSASLTAMIDRAERDPDFYKQQFNILKDEPLVCLDSILELCMANGTIKESEFNVLKGLAEILEVNDEDFRKKLLDAKVANG